MLLEAAFGQGILVRAGQAREVKDDWNGAGFFAFSRKEDAEDHVGLRGGRVVLIAPGVAPEGLVTRSLGESGHSVDAIASIEGCESETTEDLAGTYLF